VVNVTFRQLRVFAEVARHGSMTRAAELLHLTTPAVSMQIRELESQVGLSLFDREGRSVSLSTAGEYFLVHARRMLAGLQDAEHAMARFKRLEQGRLTIGMVGTAKYFVPQLLAQFHQERPGVEVRLRVAGNREQLVALMQQGDVDLSVMGRAPRDLAARAEGFATHPIVFVAPPQHPLARQGRMPPEALEGHDFIVREPGSGTRSAMQQFFDAHRMQPRTVMELPSNETIKQAVMAGLGLSMLSLHTVGLEMRSGLLVRLDVEGTPLMRTWNVVHLQGKLLSPAAEAFRYFILERGDALLRAHDAPLLGRVG
jgi:DNA-binding transcriptional LysR family regulator